MASVLTPDIFVQPELWLALCLSTPNANDIGASLVEIDPSYGYTRTPVPVGSSRWLLNAPGEFSNAAPFETTLDGATGLCQGWAICDAAPISTGNVWVVGSMIEPFQFDGLTDLVFDNIVLGLYD